MAKRFYKKYGNKGWAFNYMQSESYVKMPVSAWCYIPTSLPQEQAAKSSVVRIQVLFVLFTVEEGVANTCIWLIMPLWSMKSTTLAG